MRRGRFLNFSVAPLILCNKYKFLAVKVKRMLIAGIFNRLFSNNTNRVEYTLHAVARFTTYASIHAFGGIPTVLAVLLLLSWERWVAK
jgi:hypothetical protein